MIRYFPIDRPAFEMKMNARAYGGPLIEIDADLYVGQVRQRRSIVLSDAKYYHRCSDGAIEAAWEVALHLMSGMARSYPQWFQFEPSGNRLEWRNTLLDEHFDVVFGDAGSLPEGVLSPLDLIGRQLQEDLILMQPNASRESICVAGHLCFAAGWCLGDKIGRSFLQIHSDVPLFDDQIGRASDLLMRRLQPGRSAMRCNWTISESDDLDRSPRCRHLWSKKGSEIDSSNAGERCYFRVERQTLTNLPKTGSTLFTIHTYINSIAEVCADPERLRLLRGAIRTMPDETVSYKRATAYYPALVEYLDRLAAD
jgi:dimethylamine monooxygenase subunit A